MAIFARLLVHACYLFATFLPLLSLLTWQPEDVAEILSTIPNIPAFNASLQRLICDPNTGLWQ